MVKWRLCNDQRQQLSLILAWQQKQMGGSMKTRDKMLLIQYLNSLIVHIINN